MDGKWTITARSPLWAAQGSVVHCSLSYTQRTVSHLIWNHLTPNQVTIAGCNAETRLSSLFHHIEKFSVHAQQQTKMAIQRGQMEGGVAKGLLLLATSTLCWLRKAFTHSPLLSIYLMPWLGKIFHTVIFNTLLKAIIMKFKPLKCICLNFIWSKFQVTGPKNDRDISI